MFQLQALELKFIFSMVFIMTQTVHSDWVGPCYEHAVHILATPQWKLAVYICSSAHLENIPLVKINWLDVFLLF